jgi:hypothetical protein
MIVIGIILGAFGIGFFCWLLFALAVYPSTAEAHKTPGFSSTAPGFTAKSDSPAEEQAFKLTGP